jgi:ureidoglycolate hydrolase
VIVEPLTDEAFRPFGQVLARPSAEPNARSRGWSWWAEVVHLPSAGSPYAVGYLDLEPTEPAFDWAECHERAVELIIPLAGDCLVYVAPAGDEPRGFRVFRVGAGEGVLLDAGVWHGAPLALERRVVAAVFLVRGTGDDDTILHRFPDSPIRIEVR